MTKTKKKWLGVFTFSPIIFGFLYLLSFIGLFFGTMFLKTGVDDTTMPIYFMSSFALIFILAGIVTIITLALMIYYIIHASQNPKLDSNDRLLWIIVMIFSHNIGYIIYWYLKIWKDEDTDETQMIEENNFN